MKSSLFWGFTHRRLVVGPDCLTLEDGTDILSRNVGIQLPICAASNPTRKNISFTLRPRPELTQGSKKLSQIWFFKARWLIQIFHYNHAPHNDVSVNDGPHVRRQSRNVIIYYYIILRYNIIILKFNIVIFTFVLQLPTVSSRVTRYTGL